MKKKKKIMDGIFLKENTSSDEFSNLGIPEFNKLQSYVFEYTQINEKHYEMI